MKKSLIIAAILGLTVVNYGVAAETEKVCVTDQKTKKETCKVIKKHKKLEGTKVPEKK